MWTICLKLLLSTWQRAADFPRLVFRASARHWNKKSAVKLVSSSVQLPLQSTKEHIWHKDATFITSDGWGAVGRSEASLDRACDRSCLGDTNGTVPFFFVQSHIKTPDCFVVAGLYFPPSNVLMPLLLELWGLRRQYIGKTLMLFDEISWWPQSGEHYGTNGALKVKQGLVPDKQVWDTWEHSR